MLISYPTGRSLPPLSTAQKEIEGQVRIVTIPGADVCACWHSYPHHRSGGADQDPCQRELQGRCAAERGVRCPCADGGTGHARPSGGYRRALLSAKADQTAVAVHRVYDEYTALKFTHFGLCSQLFDALAQLTAPDADAIRTPAGAGPDRLHRLAVRLTRNHHRPVRRPAPTERGTGYCLARRDWRCTRPDLALNSLLSTGAAAASPASVRAAGCLPELEWKAFLREQK